MLEVVVDNRIRICAEGLEPELTAALKDAFSHANPAFELRRAIGVPTWGEPRTIRTWRAEHTPAGAGLSFPRGGMQRVRDAFAEHGVDWREVDNREPGLPADIPDLLRELYPYQAELLGPLIARENAILRAPTGSGKSLCALAIAARLKLPTVVMVHTRALFDQWVQRARDDLGLRKSAVGKIRGGLWKVGDLTIAIQKSLAVAFARNDLRALKLADETGLFIVDEVQGSSAKTFMETIEPFRARYRFGISANECVARGTRIVMADGSWKPIESIVVGERVATPLGPRRVRAVIFTGLLETVRVEAGEASFRCTDNTLFGTPFGWHPPESEYYPFTYAKTLFGLRRRDEKALHDPVALSLQTKWVRRDVALPNVWETGASRASSQRSCDDPQGWFRPVGEREDKGHGCPVGEHFGSYVSTPTQDPYACEASTRPCHAHAGGKGEGLADEAEAIRQRRMGGVRRAAVGDAQPSSVGVSGCEDSCRGRLCSQPPDGHWQRQRAPLRDRFRAPEEANCGGDRWEQPQFAKEQETRFGEGCVVAGTWLESGSVPTRGDDQALYAASESLSLVRATARLRDERLVFPTFDLEVEEASCFFAEGILVHNTRKDKKEFLIYDMFGAVAAEVTRDTLIDSGHVLDVEVRVIPTAFEAPWYGLTDGEESKELDFNRLLNEMGADPTRTKLALDVAQREVEAGEQVLLMTHHRDLCRVLDRALAERNIRTGFLVGGEPKEFEATVRGLAKGKVRAAVGTFQAVGTGIDLPRVGVGIAVTPIAGNQQFFNQVRGRLCRTAAGKTSARIYYLLDTAVYPSSHLRNLVKWNRKVVVWKDGKWVDAAKVLRPGRAA